MRALSEPARPLALLLMLSISALEPVARAQQSADPGEPRVKKPGEKSDLIKLAAELRTARDGMARNREIRVTSRARGTLRSALAPPAASRVQLQWPSFDRWHITWPESAPDRLALVWPE